MKEIGGYIELDKYTGVMLHDDGIKLNCGRNALEYLVLSKGINKMYFPKFMCKSNNEILKKHNIEVKYYSIGIDFKPQIDGRTEDEWLYLVNYYGQLSNEYIQTLGKNIIVDNAQAYFQKPIEKFDTIYVCRKFFGVSDGAILYTNVELGKLPRDESYKRMGFLLGRFERTASEFYQEYIENNESFFEEPLMEMSLLTENLLHAIDYDVIRQKRTHNFRYLNNKIGAYNELNLVVPDGAFMYPFYIKNGAELRKVLQQNNIFIPILWPNVCSLCNENELEYDMAKNILPLPIDQRYEEEDMEYMINEIMKCIN